MHQMLKTKTTIKIVHRLVKTFTKEHMTAGRVKSHYVDRSQLYSRTMRTHRITAICWPTGHTTVMVPVATAVALRPIYNVVIKTPSSAVFWWIKQATLSTVITGWRPVFILFVRIRSLSSFTASAVACYEVGTFWSTGVLCPCRCVSHF